MNNINGYILSYNNPDTDSVCSSIALAHYYKATLGKNYIPVISGFISEETKFVLNVANINPDSLVNTIPFPTIHNVILVDTHQFVQVPFLHDPNNVIEVWDHHPDGDTFPYAKVHNYKIGAIASKIVEELNEKNLLDRKFAILLGSSIISNTINFIAPSTTKYDYDMLELAKKYYPFEDHFITEMLSKRDAILKLSISEILINDIKNFLINGTKCGVSQIEVSSADELINNTSLLPSIQNLVDKETYDIYMCNIIDISKRISYLIPGNKQSREIINDNIICETREGIIFKINRVLLRKTDILPAIIGSC